MPPAPTRLLFPRPLGAAPPLVFCPFEDCHMPAELQRHGKFLVVGCHHVRPDPEKGRSSGELLAVFDPDENDDED